MRKSGLDDIVSRHNESISAEWRKFVQRTEETTFSPQQAWNIYAYGFKLAADAVANDAIEHRTQEALLAPPLIFLGRHWIELELKTLWNELYRRSWISSRFELRHGIISLWHGVKLPLVCRKIIHENDAFVAKIDKSFSLINSVDETSIYSRYPESKTGEIHWLEFDIENFILAINDIETFFFGLSAMIDQYDEFQS